mmetsp:Transcript_5988/g.19070  ORF Transcript_5988/g.19070 Transcript_5988/m.19070 type:complete len:139 (-) Transcript_5988:20-436(-)
MGQQVSSSFSSLLSLSAERHKSLDDLRLVMANHEGAVPERGRGDRSLAGRAGEGTVFTLAGDPADMFHFNPRLAVGQGLASSLSSILRMLKISDLETSVLHVMHDSVGGVLVTVLTAAGGMVPLLRVGQSTEVFYESV